MEENNPSFAIVKAIFILTFMCFAAFVLSLLIRPNFNENTYKDTGIKVKYLQGSSLDFLKQNYKPNSKKLVAYLPNMIGTTCPQLKGFETALKATQNERKWQQYYAFIPQVNSVYAQSHAEGNRKIKELQDFIENICGNICIIDTQENWVFAIPRPDLLPISLETFKD